MPIIKHKDNIIKKRVSDCASYHVERKARQHREVGERPNKKAKTIVSAPHYFTILSTRTLRSHSIPMENTDRISNHFLKDLIGLCDLAEKIKNGI